MIHLGDVRAIVIFSDDPSRLAAWYKRLFALREVVSSPDFIGLWTGAVTLFAQRTSEGHRPGIGGIRPHFTVTSCQSAFAELVQAGATPLLPVTDTGGELVAALQDPDGNPLGLFEPRRG